MKKLFFNCKKDTTTIFLKLESNIRTDLNNNLNVYKKSKRTISSTKRKCNTN